MSLVRKLVDKILPPEGGFKCAAVVVAAGSSRRMEGENKLFIPLCGVPVLARSLLAMNACGDIKEIVVVSREEDMVAIAGLCNDYGITKVTKVVKGGDTRLESAWRGVQEVSPQARLIAVQDGARPLADQKLIAAVIRDGESFNAAIPAVQVQDTVKKVSNFTVAGTPDRAELYAVQTPQVFKSELLKGALQRAIEKKLEITDDSMALEDMGVSVHVTPGSRENIKITTPVDIAIAESILKMRGEA